MLKKESRELGALQPVRLPDRQTDKTGPRGPGDTNAPAEKAQPDDSCAIIRGARSVIPEPSIYSAIS